MQAVGKDKIYPGVNFFAYGYTANNDPYRGYILVFVLAFGFAMFAKLNTVSVIGKSIFSFKVLILDSKCLQTKYFFIVIK